MDEQRALMDQLMGANRDLAPDEAAKRKRNFWDPEIDKLYLCGLCPAIVFKNTKSEAMVKAAEGICDDACKKEWDALPQTEKDKWGYEYDLLMCLEDLVSQCDKQIAAHKTRIEKKVELTEAEQIRVDAIHAEIKEKTTQSEELGEKGEVFAAQAVMKEIETLLTEKANIQLGHLNPVGQGAQRERNLFVCEVSGNYLCSTDNETRLRNHFSGKMYRGWKEVRDRYEELKKQNPPRVAYRDRPSGLDNSSPSSRTSARRDRERQRERRDTRERERDREREKRDKSERYEKGNHSERDREKRGERSSTEANEQSKAIEKTDRDREDARARDKDSGEVRAERDRERRDRTEDRERRGDDKRDRDEGGKTRKEKDSRSRRTHSFSRSRSRERRRR